MASIMDFTPFVPGEKTLDKLCLPGMATDLNRESAKLTGRLAEQSANTIRDYMSVINSYYSNLIEGHRTLPREIREALRGDYSEDSAKRDLQKESLAHIEVQKWVHGKAPTFSEVCSPDFILELHRRFYEGVPAALREVRDEAGEVKDRVVPGEWRKRDVTVGNHLAPDADSLDSLMSRFCEEYGSSRYQGDKRLIALASAHHRFLWVHPFLDGNGRVARLWTDAAIQSSGLESYGVWCLSRGLAKDAGTYKTRLARADFPQQGSTDGRGYLSDRELGEFCHFILATALDQVRYISQLLDLPGLKRRIEGYVQARNDGRVIGMEHPLREAASTILYEAFLHGELKRADAIELTRMGTDRSARRLLKQLKDEGLLSETSSRSPLKWEIPEHAEPWYFPDLAAVS